MRLKSAPQKVNFLMAKRKSIQKFTHQIVATRLLHVFASLRIVLPPRFREKPNDM